MMQQFYQQVNRTPLLVRCHYCLRSSLRYHSTLPPAKSYISNSSPLIFFWRRRLSQNVKYFSLLLFTALGLKHIHPNVLLTLGPPTIAGSWFLYRKANRHIYEREVLRILPKSAGELQSNDGYVAIKKYDESSIDDSLHGIESEYDNLRIQVVGVAERWIKDYAFRKLENGNGTQGPLLDANNQFSIKLSDSDVETFMSLKAVIPSFENELNEAESEKPIVANFIKLSLPYYSSEDISKERRLGIIELYLLEDKLQTKEDRIVYKMRLEMLPYEIFNFGNHRSVAYGDPGTIYKSTLLEK